MEGNMIVRFDKWCQKCKYSNNKENEEPCEECLTQGWNTSTTKPINFQED